MKLWHVSLYNESNKLVTAFNIYSDAFEIDWRRGDVVCRPLLDVEEHPFKGELEGPDDPELKVGLTK